MGHGAHTKFYKSLASGATFTSAFDLGRAYGATYLDVPTMTSNTQLHIHGSYDGTIFRRVMHPPINSSTVGANDFAIASNVTNRIVPIPNGFRYMKIESTATVDNGCLFTIITSDF